MRCVALLLRRLGCAVAAEEAQDRIVGERTEQRGQLDGGQDIAAVEEEREGGVNERIAEVAEEQVSVVSNSAQRLMGRISLGMAHDAPDTVTQQAALKRLSVVRIKLVIRNGLERKPSAEQPDRKALQARMEAGQHGTLVAAKWRREGQRDDSAGKRARQEPGEEALGPERRRIGITLVYSVARIVTAAAELA